MYLPSLLLRRRPCAPRHSRPRRRRCRRRRRTRRRRTRRHRIRLADRGAEAVDPLHDIQQAAGVIGTRVVAHAQRRRLQERTEPGVGAETGIVDGARDGRGAGALHVEELAAFLRAEGERREGDDLLGCAGGDYGVGEDGEWKGEKRQGA